MEFKLYDYSNVDPTTEQAQCLGTVEAETLNDAKIKAAEAHPDVTYLYVLSETEGGFA